MNWTKIPTDLITSRTPDRELIAIIKYQLLWATLERQPDDEIALRYMTQKQLSIALQYLPSIKQQLCNDIKYVENHRNCQKNYYEKKQTLSNKTDNHSDNQCDSQTERADKIRLDKNPPIVPQGDSDCLDYDEFMSRWNRNADKHDNFTAINVMNSQRKSSLSKRMKDLKSNGIEPTVDNFFKSIGKAYMNSSFLRGEKNNFNFTLDFVLQASSFQKLLEGGYND